MRRWSGLVLVLVGAACGAAQADVTVGLPPTTTTTPIATPTNGGTTTTTTATTTTTTTTTTSTTGRPQVVWPLTGRPADATAPAYRRPALVVKIDNGPLARPQSGLNAADVVVEEIVESATRYLAVFHSSDADPIGPIRSARTSDLAVLAALGRPLFAWSGGNPGVRAAVGAANVVDVGFETAPRAAYFRRVGRSAPSNLYSSTASLREVGAAAGATDGAPPALFELPASPAGPLGRPASAIEWRMEGVVQRWDWVDGRFVHSVAGRPHLDRETGEPIVADNVVVLEVAYRPSPADPRSPEAVTVGGGAATVAAGGRAVTGTWSRGRADAALALRTEAGDAIALRPGRTWLVLVRPVTALSVE